MQLFRKVVAPSAPVQVMMFTQDVSREKTLTMVATSLSTPNRMISFWQHPFASLISRI